MHCHALILFQSLLQPLYRCATFAPGGFMGDNVGSKVSYLLVGMGIGAVLMLLFAPQSGEETRDYLSKKAEEGKEYAQRKARELRERADDLLERSKEVAKNQKDSISAAVEAGREAYQREKAKAQ